MSERAYKATESKLDHVRMLMLTHRGFLARSAYTDNEARVAGVADVDLGDFLNVYYRDKTKLRTLGRFEVVSPVGHPFEKAFGAKVEGTQALYIVEDPTFIFEIDKDEVYQPDPVIDKLTGWCIRRTTTLAVPYRENMFKFRQVLAQI